MYLTTDDNNYDKKGNETSRINQQWLWDYATKFARWQHPAMGEIWCVWHQSNCCFWLCLIPLIIFLLSRYRHLTLESAEALL